LFFIQTGTRKETFTPLLEYSILNKERGAFMLTSYQTIKENGQHEIDIKKSRFICSMARVETEEEAKDFIQAVKKEHWKATHNCSAFTLGDKHEIQRSSDDGEPSGTAGVPMLEVLKKRDLINTVAVVTRYFGGIKLGAGGLIRAYSSAVSEAVKAIGVVEGRLQQEVFITVDYAQHGKLEHFLENNPFSVKDTVFTDQVKVVVMVQEEQVTDFEKQVINLLSGQCQISTGATVYFEYAVPY